MLKTIIRGNNACMFKEYAMIDKKLILMFLVLGLILFACESVDGREKKQDEIILIAKEFVSLFMSSRYSYQQCDDSIVILDSYNDRYTSVRFWRCPKTPGGFVDVTINKLGEIVRVDPGM